MKRTNLLAYLFGLTCFGYVCQAHATEQPDLVLAAPDWAFEPLAIADSYEPEWVGAAFADYINSELLAAIGSQLDSMDTVTKSKVSPFANDDLKASPFDDDAKPDPFTEDAKPDPFDASPKLFWWSTTETKVERW